MPDYRYEPEIVVCPLCGEVTIKQEMNFWQCPVCDTEIWPPEGAEDEDDEHQQILEAYYEDVHRKDILHKGRSSNKSRRFGNKKHVVRNFTGRYYLP